jgi:transaldolase
MARPASMHTRIFLDGSDLSEMDTVKETLGFLDGQTTNPSNFVKALKKEQGAETENFTEEKLLERYKKRIQEISKKVPDGSVSIEVYADANSTPEDLITQGKEMNTWIPNAHIKLPITTAGLAAAKALVALGIKVNMTLCFTEEQAAAVYTATQGAKKGDVFISPFIGRLNDTGKNGMDLIKNILQLYKEGDGHVEVLAASIRTGEQLAEAIAVGADITTSYKAAIDEWAESGMPVLAPDEFNHPAFTPIPYQGHPLDKAWSDYTITHEMTDDGLRRFAEDWNNLLT